MPPLRTPWTLHLGLPDPGPNIPQRRRDRTNSLPPRETFPQEKSGCYSPPPLLAPRSPVIGTGIAAALGTRIGGISTSAHFYYMLSQELNEGMERVVESFVSIQRQKRRALDLLTEEKGAICLFLGEDCCYFVNERGIVQGRVKELRDRMNAAEMSYKTFTLPKTCSNRYSFGCSLSWDHWYLSFYSSYLDPVSSISFKGFSKNGFWPSLEIRSRPSFFLRASPQAQKKETMIHKTILHSRPKTVAPIQQDVAREIRRPFPHFFYDFRVWNEGVFWA